MNKLATLLGLWLLCLWPAAGRAESVQLYHIGVGQGDATLIVVTNNSQQKASILIDAGNSKSKGTAVLGVLQTVLGTQKRVDVIITSHLHSDHLGGMPTVIGALADNGWTIGTVLDRSAQNYAGDDSCYTENTTSAIDRLNDDAPPVSITQLVRAQRGLVDGLYSRRQLYWLNVAPGIEVFSNFISWFSTSARLRCLTSNGHVCTTATNYDYPNWLDLSAQGKNENDFSYSFLFELGSFKYFTGGDIGGGAPYVDLETPLVKLFQTRPDAGTFHFCAYKASHHGSLHSTNQGFVSFTKPTLTVVPSALRSFSGTKLPSETTLQRLDGVNSVLRYTYIWASSGGSSRSSGSVTNYRDVTITVDGATYETSHQMQVCSTQRNKGDLQLVPSTQACETVTCNQHASTLALRGSAPPEDAAARAAFVQVRSMPLPGAPAAPAAQAMAGPAARAPGAVPRRHRHFWPWRWGHRHLSTALEAR